MAEATVAVKSHTRMLSELSLKHYLHTTLQLSESTSRPVSLLGPVSYPASKAIYHCINVHEGIEVKEDGSSKLFEIGRTQHKTGIQRQNTKAINVRKHAG